MAYKQIITDFAKQGMALLIKRRGESVRKQLLKALNLLADNPRHPSLETHKLKRWPDWFEAKVNRGDRLVFRVQENTQVIAWCGDHNELDRDGFGPAIIDAEVKFLRANDRF